MEEIHQIVLRTLEPWLLEHMSISLMLLAKLHASYVLNRQEKEQLEITQIPAEKVAMLLNILRKKDDGAFLKFRLALMDDEQEAVAQQLGQKEQALKAENAFPAILDLALNISAESSERLREVEDILLDTMKVAAIRAREHTTSGDAESASHFFQVIQGAHRTIIDINRKCIIISVECPTPTSLIQLLDVHRSGELETLFEQEFISTMFTDVLTVTLTIELRSASPEPDSPENRSDPGLRLSRMINTQREHELSTIQRGIANLGQGKLKVPGLTDLRYAELQVPGLGKDAQQASSIPLVLPDNYLYDPSTMKVSVREGATRGSLRVIPEACQMLEQIEEPISILAICGPARTGKSYVLSRFLGKPDAFELGNTFDPQTTGIWIGTSVVKGKDETGNAFCIVVLDTEGIDAVSAESQDDSGIFILTILLSSYLIYNSIGVPRRSDLEDLRIFSTIASNIQLSNGKSLGAESGEYLPEFMWLMRDVLLQFPKGRSGRPMSATEYLLQKVFKNDIADRELNATARSYFLFSNVEGFSLPPPHMDPVIVQNIVAHTADLNPSFNEGVEKWVMTIMRRSAKKRMRGFGIGTKITGKLYSKMVYNYVNVTNDPHAIPVLKNSWEAIKDAVAKEAKQDLMAYYREHMQEEIDTAATVNGKKVPLEEYPVTCKIGEDKSLYSIHFRVFSEAVEAFRKRISPLGATVMAEELNSFKQMLVVYEDVPFWYEEPEFQSAKETFYGDLEICLQKQKVDLPVISGGAFVHFVQENRRISAEFNKQLYMDLSKEIKRKAETDSYTIEQFQTDMTGLEEEYTSKALGPCKYDILPEMSDLMQKHCRRFLCKYKSADDMPSGSTPDADSSDELAKECSRLKATLELLRKELKKSHDELEKEREDKLKKMEQEKGILDNAEQDKAAKSGAAGFQDIAQRMGLCATSREQQHGEETNALATQSRLREEEMDDAEQRESLLHRIARTFRNVGHAIATPFRKIHRWVRSLFNG